MSGELNVMKQRIMSRLILVFVVAGMASAAGAESATPKIFNIRSYGAIGDGVAMETEAVQKAIDSCHDAGGGTVRVPAGDFQIGTIQLRSNVTLSLDYGASLLGSQNLADYPTEGLDDPREGWPALSDLCQGREQHHHRGARCDRWSRDA